jgi:patatin-related protein
MSTTDGENTKELRLALVCYGGVSLAIYMHGVTKEIHKLVRASAKFEEDPTTNPFGRSQVERAYFEALRARTKNGVRTRVVVDIIAGTSAGGINGIVLAKALAGNRSQEALRDLWLDKGDIRTLLNIPWAPGVIGKALAWLVGRQLVPSLLERIPGLGKLVEPSPPLDGDLMFKLVHEALEKMDDTPRQTGDRPSLLPDGHVLELFVTMTDMKGYDRQLYLYDPRQVRDPAHRHVLTFRHDGNGTDNFDRRYNAFLAFAARATSCFPGAFPPINLASIRRNVPASPEIETIESDFFAIYRACRAEPAKTYFIDGGVLDNYPFGSAIAAIARRPAAYEVERLLLYIEPDPLATIPPENASPARTAAGAPAKGDAPGWLATIWAGISGLPREEPILDDLLELRAYNSRVEQVHGVVAAAFKWVEDEVLGDARSGEERTVADVTHDTWRRDVNERAAELCGPAYVAYARLKLRAVVETFAAIAAAACGYPPESNQAFFIQDVLVRWAEDRDDLLGAPASKALSEAQRAFLRSFDLGYSQRRIRFVIRGINDLYATVEATPAAPNRVDLNAAKEKLYALHAEVDGVIAGRGLDELAGAVRGVFGNGAIEKALDDAGDLDRAVRAFAAREASRLDELRRQAAALLDRRLAGFGERLHDEIVEITREWEAAAARTVLVHHLGFPLWDALVYPMLKLSDMGELQRINVMRLSPNDARMLSTCGSRRLGGVKLAHFGAFFRRADRENDYLWGRLDTAERLLRMLHGDEGTVPLCKKAFTAILDEEEPALTQVQDLVRRLRARVANL